MRAHTEKVYAPKAGHTMPPLCCPLHGTPLTNDGAKLACDSGCGFPIRNSIPRFVKSDNYAAAFGLQWNKYRQTQLDSFTGHPISRERLIRCLGESAWKTIEGKQVLEAGCGAGRFTDVLLAGGASVTSVDLSDAVDANQQSCPQNECHRILQADILKLPFAEKQFDIVLCLGVIQHTPGTERTIAALYGNVKPGGLLVIDHYRFNWSYYTRTHWMFRAILKRLPAQAALNITNSLTKLLWPLHVWSRHRKMFQTIITRISPLSCYFDLYPEMNLDFHYQLSLLDTHDSLTDHYKRFRTSKQIAAALEKTGAAEIECWHGGNGIEARARRPLERENIKPGE
jgi:2-polyprenyl-3-methyl-5-hydroxy-6-metoxy-1,4-benzoquinol methylase